MTLEQSGVPAVAVVTDAFESLARGVAASLGYPGLALVTLRHPINTLGPDEVVREVDRVLDAVRAAATGAGAGSGPGAAAGGAR